MATTTTKPTTGKSTVKKPMTPGSKPTRKD